MNFNRISIWTAIGSAVFLLIGALLVWFFFFRSSATVSTDGTTSSFGTVPDTTNTAPASTDTSGSQTINTTSSSASQKIFKISSGPVVGATLLQTLRPTTTIARYIRQDDGHVFDVPLGVSGAVPHVVSNITIPGGQRAIWLEGGAAVLMQYVDDNSIIKTVYLGFPVATTSVVLPAKIQFLPDNIVDVAASPDTRSLVYLLKTANGSDGYIAKSDGTEAKKTFSLPLSELLASWPASGTILVQTKSAAGVTGMAFSVDVKTGSTAQLIAAPGLSAIANQTFSQLVYVKSDGSNQFTYAHSIKTGIENRLSFNPLPEKCLWGNVRVNILYCANAIQAVQPNYLDLWHQGAVSSPDGIFAYNPQTGGNIAVAIPGSSDGGAASDILEMSLSPDEHYLSYTTKGDRSVWGVLLSQ